MAYTLISDLDTSRDNWLIKVRVCRMWEFKNYKRSNEMISLNMILIDKKVLPFHFYVIRHCWMVWLLGIHLPINIKQGTLVHAVILRNQVNRFRANLREGSVIIIRNFKVSESIGE